MGYVRKSIDLSLLNINIENPRFEMVGNQREAIKKMIDNYGADSVRWFILSDSPPEKDILWSDRGINAAYKFLQKVWNLNSQINLLSERKGNLDIEKKYEKEFSKYILTFYF